MNRIIILFLVIAIGCNTSTPTQNNPDNKDSISLPNNTFSCPINEEGDIHTEVCKPKMDCSFSSQQGHTVNVSMYQGNISSAEIIPGYAQTFEMNRTYQDDPRIADDEFTEKLFFEVPSGLTNFQIQDEELKAAKMIYATLAYSRDGGYYGVEKGCMEGKKLEDNSWKIQGEVTIITRTKREITVSIKATYTTP